MPLKVAPFGSRRVPRTLPPVTAATGIRFAATIGTAIAAKLKTAISRIRMTSSFNKPEGGYGPLRSPSIALLRSSKRLQKCDQSVFVILVKCETEHMARYSAMDHARTLPASRDEVVFQAPWIEPVFQRTYR